MRDQLGESKARVPVKRLYRCLYKVLAHRQAMFSFLRERWQSLFDSGFEVLLYDLTSTCFESDPLATGRRRHGCSRDKRPGRVLVVIALIVTPEGFPLAYEVMSENTKEGTTSRGVLDSIEQQYGRSQRAWVMDRGIPTEDSRAAMRAADHPVHYLVGTSKGRLNRLEKGFPTWP